jgi:hypothetical protein
MATLPPCIFVFTRHVVLFCCAQAVAYLRSRGVVLDLAAMEVDTKATRTAGRVSK